MQFQSLQELGLHYEGRFSPDEDPLSVMFMNDVYQRAAFDLVMDLLDDIKYKDSIVDIGCGYGHLLGHLRNAGWTGRYTGVDVVPQFIAAAKDRFKEDSNAQFICGAFGEGCNPVADVCIAVNIFGVAPGDGSDFMDKILDSALKTSGDVVATFNCEDRRVLPLTAKSYGAGAVVTKALRSVRTMTFKHRFIDTVEGGYALAGICLQKDLGL